VSRRGTYEIRYKVLATGSRGISQLYFGSDPENLPVTGIPIDIRKNLRADLPNDFMLDSDDDEYNDEIDKFLRNNNRMRGSNSVTGDGYASERLDPRILRHLVTRQTLDPDKTYYLRFKSVLDKQQNEFYMDYLEICPKEVYDNPETPEDTW